jgi:CRISPR-associated endonuclease/helicase Cas3
MDAWAHVKPSSDRDCSELPHLLFDHLREVARRAADFASPFGGADWASLAGLWHDLGKYRPSFQAKLWKAGGIDAHIEGAPGRVTHSNAGALHAISSLGELRGRVLAYLIAGHHAGLPDRHASDGAGASLDERLRSADAQRELHEALAQSIPDEIRACPLRPDSACPGGADGFALWLRMLFSCLVDADFLDTEAFFAPDRRARRGVYPALEAMKDALDAHMATMTARAASGHISPMNMLRAGVLARCRDAAALPSGFFTMTVPTGGGKTLSSLAFALNHALEHRKRRIVYAIPYTSIIEQTAEVFAGIFKGLGEDVVVEHHSNLDVDERTENHSSRLASENWDAPLIVTTNVQLFESLHAARTSRCRKLHNLAGSVIVLDEAQMLPRDFLAPVLRTLKLLVAYYNVSVVLCTATQPTLSSRFEPVTNRKLLDGIDTAHAIVADEEPLFDALQRVDVHLPVDFRAVTPWEILAADIARHDCVLSIVNTRRHARELFERMPADGAEHLSALMCAAHRSAVIKRIKARLAAKREGSDLRPLRVISTQLVEAGVDLDFPVVYRALAGLDSIAQAAGRCNREGTLNGQHGQVHVFIAPGGLPPGELAQAAQTTREMAGLDKLAKPLSPATFRAYFDQFYAKDTSGNFDREGVLNLQTIDRAAFRSAARAFKLIDDDGESVIVPYNANGGPNSASEVHGWLGALAKDGDATWARRKLQRYTINLPRGQFEQLIKQGDIKECAGLWLALDIRYDSTLGLCRTDDLLSPSDLTI